jgi:thiamine-monophosphate kinase
LARTKEFDLIARYFAPLARQSSGARGLLDDAAVLTPPAGYDLVITKDMMAENIHFLSNDPPETIGHKLLAVNLSDLAAMGAAPFGSVLGLGIPRGDTTENWIAEFARGLGEAALQFNCPLVGGDTIGGLERWTLSLTAFGIVPKGAALGRAGAKLGDLVCVSGTVGQAGLGLAELKLAVLQKNDVSNAVWVKRYQQPIPRLALGQALRGIASACTDVSDGLLADAGHIASASGLGVEIEMALVPHDPAQTPIDAATSGDDYELVFTLPPSKMDALLTLSKDLGLMLTVIGRMIDGQGVQVKDVDGTVFTPERLGFQHG